MANNLKKCEDCGKEISIDAKKCPGCGKLVELVFERNGYEQAFLSGLCCSNKCFNKYWKESLDYLKEKRN